MKKSRYTDERIAFALWKGETGTPVKEVILKMGIAEPDLLTLEEVVRRAGPFRGASIEATGEGESPFKADGGRSLAG